MVAPAALCVWAKAARAFPQVSERARLTSACTAADDAVPVTVDARYEGCGAPALTPAQVADFGERMLRALGMQQAELSVLLCDDQYIQALNRQYRDIDRATDVLAFPMQEGGAFPTVGPVLLGDVVISLATAGQQAHARDRPLALEVVELLAHGLLHLLGFDHASRDEERRMVARTDLLVSSLGVALASVEKDP